MIVVMEPGATPEQIADVVTFVEHHGLHAHLSPGEDRTVIGVIGHEISEDLRAGFQNLTGVEDVVRITRPYKLSGRQFRQQDTEIPVGEVVIGGPELVVMAGPCAVENQAMLMETAQAVRASGASILRGGAFKPRTSPYTFQGLGLEGLRILEQARLATGLPVVTEVMTPGDVETVAGSADILQIGARNMQNFNLLAAVGETRVPVLLKRGASSTLEEWLLSAEYILSRGNYAVMLCERGIRTFETATRNTLDLSCVPLLKEWSHLPVVVDPSHGTGRSQLVTPMALAAVAAGADALIIEVHPHPQEAWSDGPQSLAFPAFEALMRQVATVAEVVGRPLARPTPGAAGGRAPDPGSPGPR